MSDIKVGDIVRHVNVVSCMTVKVADISGDWASYPDRQRLDGRFNAPLRDLETVVPFLDAVRDDDGHMRERSLGVVPTLLEVTFPVNLRPHTEAEYRSTLKRLEVLERHYRNADDQVAFRKRYGVALAAHERKLVDGHWRAWQDELRRRGGMPALSDLPPRAPARSGPWPVPDSERKWFFGD